MRQTVVWLTLLFLGSLCVQSALPCECPMPGDVDNSGTLNVSDLTYLVAYLFAGGPDPAVDSDCPSDNRGDVDCSMAVNVSDLTYFVAHLFQGGVPPCNPCYDFLFDGSEVLSSDYVIWFDTNMYNATIGGTPSAFVYLNHPGVVSNAIDYLVGDTTVTESHAYVEDSDGSFLQVAASPATANVPADPPLAVAPASRQTDRVVRVNPWQTIVNGTQVENTSFTVQGNVVSFQGRTIDFGSPFPYGPPTIGELMIASATNPPNQPTAQEVAAACDGETLSRFFNDDMLNMTQTHRSTWTTDGGQTAEVVRTYQFSFHHYWAYTCPDGPLERKLHISITYQYRYYLDGTLQDTIEIVQNYNRRFTP